MLPLRATYGCVAGMVDREAVVQSLVVSISGCWRVRMCAQGRI